MRALAVRLIGAIGTMLIVSIIAFGLVFLAPGDPAMQIARQRSGGVPTSQDVARIRTAFGLDQPVPVQYGLWAQAALQGDLGYSFRTGEPVVEETWAAIWPTVILAVASLALALAIGIPIGVLAAWRPGSRVDQLARLGGMLGATTPEFLVGYGLILVFAVGLGWLPSFGMRDPLGLVLPALTISAGVTARVSFFVRSLLVRERPAIYLLMARAKGLRPWQVGVRHLVPNVVGPFIQFAALQFGGLATGLAIVETLFAWPGLGLTLVEAVRFRDIPMIQALVMIFALTFLGINALADVCQTWLDPRARAS